MKRIFRRWPGAAVAAFLLVGCGAQELYAPPDAPLTVVGRLALPSQSKGVDVLGDYAYVAGGQAGLHIIDISDPANPRLVKTLDTVKYAESVQVASTASDFGVFDIAFVVEGTEGVTTYDITDPEAAYSFNQGTTAVDGDGLFIELRDDPDEPYTVYLAESWKGLRIFEGEPTIPGLLRYDAAVTPTGGYARAVAVQDRFAYVADDEMGLSVIDVRDRTLGAVRKVSWCDTAGEAEDVDIDGNYVFIADLENGLVVMEIRQEGDPLLPVPYTVGHLPLPGKCEALVVRDGRAYIAAADAGVQVIDVSIPTAPVSLGRIITSECTDVALSNSGLVVASDKYDGLIVFDQGASFSDGIAPSKVSDLVATGFNMNRIRLQWHAPGDDRLSGTAAEYDIRYSESPLSSDAAWDAATRVVGVPVPGPRGAAETFDLTDLPPGATYYVALRTADATPNWSLRSNESAATTWDHNQPPAPRPRIVSPESGLPGTTFRFEVEYFDADGDAPSEARIFIDGTDHVMTYISGDPMAAALHRFETASLAFGGHEHYFSFSDGINPPVTTPVTSGPFVGRSTFTMGSPANEQGRDVDETQHTVVFLYDFWVSDAEVTQLEWTTLMGANPSRFVGDDRPVERVSWYDAVAFCNARSVSEGLTPAYVINGTDVSWNHAADGYRLPTEAEWESACRSGANTAFAGGDLTDEACGSDPVLDYYGWYCGNAGTSTHEVRQKSANAGGHYDMHGNVWEWCWDWYVADLGSGAAADPEGPGSGSQRVIRGGSWYYFARECRSASRSPYWPNSADDTVGFRLARTLP